MKYLIIGDLHGADLGHLRRSDVFDESDALVCTGDYDSVKTIRQFMELEEIYKSLGKKVVKVPGNHDYAVFNNLGIRSTELKKQGKTISDLYHELYDDRSAKKYIQEILKIGNRTVGFFLDENNCNYRVVAMHSAYDGDSSTCSDFPYALQMLWFRLKSRDDYSRNFSKMRQENKNVMIRGHDHKPKYVYQYFDGTIFFTKSELGVPYMLKWQMRHVINPGAFCDGHFATIDTQLEGSKYSVLKFHKL